MKKYFALLLFCTTLHVQGQITLTGSIAYQFTQFKPGLLNDFVTSYNSFYANNLSRGFDPFESVMHSYSYGFGIQAAFDKSWMNFEYTKASFRQGISSVFQNQFGRDITLRFADWNFLFDNTFGSERVRVGPVYGVSMRTGTLYSYSNWYGSDHQSLGHEYALSGIFRGIVQTNFLAGLVLRFQVSRFLMLQARAFYTLPFMGIKEDNLFAFSDASPGKNPSYEHFPHDVPAFFANAGAGGYDFEDNVIPMSFRGLNACASLVFQLNFSK